MRGREEGREGEVNGRGIVLTSRNGYIVHVYITSLVQCPDQTSAV